MNELTNQHLTPEQRDLIDFAISRNLTMPEFKITHFVGNAQITPFAKLKQYIIELNGREMAVENMIYENTKLKLEIELEKEKAESAVSPAQKKLHELEIFKFKNMLKKSELRLRDSIKERDLFLKVIEDFNQTPEAYLPDGRRLLDAIDDVELSNQLEKEYWTLRLAKQTAMDMIAYGRAGVGNMDAVTMLGQDQQFEVMQLACDFFIRNEMRNQELLNSVNEGILQKKLEQTNLAKHLMFKDNGANDVLSIQVSK